MGEISEVRGLGKVMRCNRWWGEPRAGSHSLTPMRTSGLRESQPPTLPLPGPVCSLSPSRSGGPPVSPPGARTPQACLFLPPPRPPLLAVWQRCGGGGGGRGALATGLLPPLPPPHARRSLPLPPQQQTRRRRFPSGLRGRGQDGGRGAGQVGGVKVGAQQNPPHCAQCGQTLRSDLRTGGRAGPRHDVDQSSPDPTGHVHNPSVEVSLQPRTQDPSEPSSPSPGARPAPETPAPRVPRAPRPLCPWPSHGLAWSRVPSTRAASLRTASPRTSSLGP